MKKLSPWHVGDRAAPKKPRRYLIRSDDVDRAESAENFVEGCYQRCYHLAQKPAQTMARDRGADLFGVELLVFDFAALESVRRERFELPAEG
jgi:hypothetical protein